VLKVKIWFFGILLLIGGLFVFGVSPEGFFFGSDGFEPLFPKTENNNKLVLKGDWQNQPGSVSYKIGSGPWQDEISNSNPWLKSPPYDGVSQIKLTVRNLNKSLLASCTIMMNGIIKDSKTDYGIAKCSWG